MAQQKTDLLKLNMTTLAQLSKAGGSKQTIELLQKLPTMLQEWQTKLYRDPTKTSTMKELAFSEFAAQQLDSMAKTLSEQAKHEREFLEREQKKVGQLIDMKEPAEIMLALSTLAAMDGMDWLDALKVAETDQHALRALNSTAGRVKFGLLNNSARMTALELRAQRMALGSDGPEMLERAETRLKMLEQLGQQLGEQAAEYEDKARAIKSKQVDLPPKSAGVVAA